VHYKNYNSHKQQVKITYDLNNANFQNTDPEFYNNLEVEIPNLTVAATPLKGLKAVYVNANEPDSLQKSIDMFHKSVVDNPYLMFSEGHLAQIYFQYRVFDSAYYYARKSFKGLPKNAIHFAMIAKLHANSRQYDSIVLKYNEIKSIPPRSPIIRIYLASMLNFYSEVNDSLKNSVMETAKFAKNWFLADKELQLLADYLIVGKDEVDIAVFNEEIGTKLLSEGKYLEGINSFEQALSVRKNNVGYIQTIGLAYYNIKKYKKVIENLGNLERQSILLDPISLYVKGLSHYYLRDKVKSCEYLLKASRFRVQNAERDYNLLCKFKK
jgi:tetratricopeptide (TPR) repeat protein